MKGVNPSALELLRQLKEPVEVKRLQASLGLKHSGFYEILKELTDSDYVELVNGQVRLKLNAKAALLRKVSEKFNITELLRDSNENVIVALIDPKSLQNLINETGLSYRTVYRSLESLLSIGAVVQHNGSYTLTDDSGLRLFVNLLKEEAEKGYAEPYATVLYKDALRILKRVPIEKPARGTLTAFSVFSTYGVTYHPVHNYYIQQEKELTIEDIVIHSLLAADKENDKTALIMVVIFYLINRAKMSLPLIRSTAKSFKIERLWFDVENYVRNTPLMKLDKFLPRKEFAEKAALYGINASDYELPPAYPSLFYELGEKLSQEITIYLFGGENMRMKNLKNLTKDCDLIVDNDDSYLKLKETAVKIGYVELGREYFSKDDLRIEPSTILEHESRSRIDLFVTRIAGKLVLTKTMKDRAEMKEFGKLNLGIMSNEDVFLLKAVTEREGDLKDMARLAQTVGFNWETVWKELLYQEKATGQHFCEALLYGVEALQKQEGIKAPFYRRLQTLSLDHAILRCMVMGDKTGGKTIKEIRNMLPQVPEYLIRKRAEQLVSTKFLKKRQSAGNVLYEARKRVLLQNSQRFGYDQIILDRKCVPNTIVDRVKEASVKLGLPEDVKNRAIEIAQNIKDDPEFSQRKPSVVAGVIIYYTCRYAGIPRTLEDVAIALDINKNSIHTRRSVIFNIMKKRGLLSLLQQE